MNKKILITASIIGLLAIILGAFGSHGLKKVISIESQQVFETGVRYQIIHAILLLFIGTSTMVTEKFKRITYYLITLGLLFFSGSIYALSTNALTSFDFKTIGFITPIGGFLLILAWLCLIINFTKIDS